MRFKQFLESYSEGPSSTVTHDGHKYNLDCIFKLAETVPVESFDVAQLTWMLDAPWTPDDAKREVDLSVPIIVTPWGIGQYVIIDGFHRVHRANEIGLTMIPARIIFHDILDACAS